MGSGVMLITADVSAKFLRPCFPFQTIKISLQVTKLTKVRFALTFTITNQTKEPVFNAVMTIAASKDGKIIQLPEIMYKPLKTLVA